MTIPNQSFQQNSRPTYPQSSQSYTLKQNITEDDSTFYAIIGKTVEGKIKWLCKKEPSLEWSGIIFYSIEEVNNIKYIFIKDLLLMNIGSAGYTEYQMNSAVLDFIIDKGYRDLHIGHIHSHNTMDTFFSGTDINQLIEGAKGHNVFLSLIVNNAYVNNARVSFEATTTNERLDFSGEKISYSEKKYYYSKVILLSEAEYTFESTELYDSYNKIKIASVSQLPSYSIVPSSRRTNTNPLPLFDNSSLMGKDANEDDLLTFHIQKLLVRILSNKFKNVPKKGLHLANIDESFEEAIKIADIALFTIKNEDKKNKLIESISLAWSEAIIKDSYLSVVEPAEVYSELFDVLESNGASELLEGIRDNLFI